MKIDFANHRLPPNILKNNSKGVSDLLRKIGIDDIIQIWMEIEISGSYPIVYRPPGSVSF